MKLTRRQLSLLIENYLITEGRRDREHIERLNITDEDKKLYLNGESQNPGLKIQDVSWIQNNKGTFDLFHSIQSVLAYKKIPDAFKQNLKTKAERTGDPTLLNKLNLSGFDSIQALDAFIDEANEFMQDSNALSRSKFVPLETGDDLEIVGEAGPWTVILPKTIRGSVSCDARTSKDTTWCTTKRSGQNLFYHYVGQGEINMMLFYIMDYYRKPDDPTQSRQFPFEANNDSRISLGVVNSKPRMNGKDGGLSVDASNKGYEKEDLEYALGEYYDQVMSLIESSVEKHGGISPALKTVQRAATNLDLLLKIIKDYDEQSRKVFVIKTLDQDNVSVDILNYFSNDSDKQIQGAVARNKKTPTEILSKMIEGDKALSPIGAEVARNPSTPIRLLISLHDMTKNSWESPNDRKKNVTTDNFVKHDILKGLASNPSTPTEILNDIFNTYATASSRTAGDISSELAQNTNLPPGMLKELGNSDSPLVRYYIAANSLTPLDESLLEKLANDRESYVRIAVASNKATPTYILEKLKNDWASDVRIEAEENLRNRQINERKRYSLKFLYN